MIVRVTFANHSFVDLLRLSGGSTNVMLGNLIPAHDYIVVLTAVNRDGEVTTNPVAFTTSRGFPAISNLEVERVNRTSFVVAIQLAYTGGGAINLVEVSYRPTAVRRLETELFVDYHFPSLLTVRGVVTLTDQRQQQLVEREAAMALTFKVRVRNEFDFYSPPNTVNGKAKHAFPVSKSPFCCVQCSDCP